MVRNVDDHSGESLNNLSATVTQFDLIRDLDLLLGKAQIDYWLRGGWALDFLQGEITRSHSDIDLAAWKRDAGRLRACLDAAGYKFERDLGVQMDFTKAGQELSVVFIAFDAAGRVYTPDVADWIWHETALGYPPCQLSDLSCRVLSPQHLLAEKLGYEQGTGRPLRPKDQQSIVILQQLLS